MSKRGEMGMKKTEATSCTCSHPFPSVVPNLGCETQVSPDLQEMSLNHGANRSWPLLQALLSPAY